MGVVLAVVRQEWFGYYVIAVAVVIGFFIGTPIVLAYKLSRWIWQAVFSKILKAVIFLGSMTIVTPVVFVTAGIPRLGAWFSEQKDRVTSIVTRLIELPKLGEELQDIRGMMIRVLVKVDDPKPEHSEPEPYQEELREIRKKGESRLNTGETVLSLSLGALMLVSQIWQLGIFQISFYGTAAEFVIQAGLFVIAVSIGYRVAVMDFLSFSGGEEFQSLKEMDVAVSYQKGVCSVAFIQHLMSMVFVVAVLSKLKKDLAEDLLRIHYAGTSYRETMKEGWRRLNETQ